MLLWLVVEEEEQDAIQTIVQGFLVRTLLTTLHVIVSDLLICSSSDLFIF